MENSSSNNKDRKEEGRPVVVEQPESPVPDRKMPPLPPIPEVIEPARPGLPPGPAPLPISTRATAPAPLCNDASNDANLLAARPSPQPCAPLCRRDACKNPSCDFYYRNPAACQNPACNDCDPSCDCKSSCKCGPAHCKCYPYRQHCDGPECHKPIKCPCVDSCNCGSECGCHVPCGPMNICGPPGPCPCCPKCLCAPPPRGTTCRCVPKCSRGAVCCDDPRCHRDPTFDNGCRVRHTSERRTCDDPTCCKNDDETYNIC